MENIIQFSFDSRASDGAALTGRALQTRGQFPLLQIDGMFPLAALVLTRARLLGVGGWRLFARGGSVLNPMGAISTFAERWGVAAISTSGRQWMDMTSVSDPVVSPASSAHRAREWMAEHANRTREALQDALAVVNEYGTRTSGYFSEQVDRGEFIVEHVRTSRYCAVCGFCGDPSASGRCCGSDIFHDADRLEFPPFSLTAIPRPVQLMTRKSVSTAYQSSLMKRG